MSNRTCSVDDCNGSIRSRGYCQKHYRRLMKTGTTELVLAKDKPCSVTGCDRKQKTRGWCSKHYGRWHSTGSTDLVVEVRRCSVEGCSKKHQARGYCGSHYNQIFRSDRHKETIVVPCAACGEQVERASSTGRQSRKIACSYRCRAFLTRGYYPPSAELVGPVPKVYGPARAPRGYVNPYVVERSNPNRIFVQGGCRWCGESFMADTYSTMTIPQYCSDLCLKKYHRKVSKKRNGRFAVADRVRFAIYERDGWLCQLCFEPTSRRYEHDDPLSPTLDHIVAQANGGSDDPENLRLAHAICNSERGTGDGSGAELLGLFAF